MTLPEGLTYAPGFLTEAEKREHQIPPVKEERWSMTFRTLRMTQPPGRKNQRPF